MTDDYTPTTEDVREEYAYKHQEVDMDGYVVLSFDEAKARWDRWLNAVKAEVWQEGHTAGQVNEREHRPGRKMTNPYRPA